MNAIVIEHVKVTELPREWAAQFNAGKDARFTVRIEMKSPRNNEETSIDPSETMSAFGMWRDREEMGDVEDYLRRLRTPRLSRE